MLAGSPANAARASLMSHQDYGPNVGVPRLLALLGGYGLRATFFVPGATADDYPGLLDAILAAGHEVGHHGYLHEYLVGVDESTERRYLELGLEALDRVGGVRPATARHGGRPRTAPAFCCASTASATTRATSTQTPPMWCQIPRAS